MITMLDLYAPGGVTVIDYGQIESLNEFRSVVHDADLVWAIPTGEGNQCIVFGEEALHQVLGSGKTTPMKIVAFGLDFSERSEILEHLLGALIVTRGHAEWNGEKMYGKDKESPFRSLTDLAARFGRWGMGSKGGGKSS